MHRSHSFRRRNLPFVPGLLVVFAMVLGAGRSAADDSSTAAILDGSPCDADPAVCGLFADALTTAASIPGWSLRADALRQVAEQQVAAGLDTAATVSLHEALHLIETESALEHEVSLVQRIAGVLARAGQVDEALALAAGIDAELFSISRSRTFSEIALAQAQSGGFSAAREALAQCTPADRDWTAIWLAQALASAGEVETALDLVAEIANGLDRVRALGAVALVQDGNGAADAAQASFEQARATAEALTLEADRSDGLRYLAADLAAAGRFDEALAVIEGLDEGRDRTQALQAVSAAQTQAGQFDQALVAAEMIAPQAVTRTLALRDLAVALHAAGDEQAAEAVLTGAGEAARALADIENRAYALALVAVGRANTGSMDTANNLFAEAIDTTSGLNELERAGALAIAAIEQANAGLYDDAFATISPVSGDWEVRAVRGIAHAMSIRGDVGLAQGTLAELSERVRNASDDAWASQTLTLIARTQARAAADADTANSL